VLATCARDEREQATKRREDSNEQRIASSIQDSVVWSCRHADLREISPVSDRKILNKKEELTMSKKASEHHRKAAEHHKLAATHHEEAAAHYDKGNHEKAAHHAHVAHGHTLQATHYAAEAAKMHVEEHGSKK
jgi:hypothetical protein